MRRRTGWAVACTALVALGWAARFRRRQEPEGTSTSRRSAISVRSGDAAGGDGEFADLPTSRPSGRVRVGRLVLFIVLSAWFGFAAAAIYPDRDIVVLPRSLDIDIASAREVYMVAVDIEPYPTSRESRLLSIYVSAPSDGTTDNGLKIGVSDHDPASDKNTNGAVDACVPADACRVFSAGGVDFETTWNFGPKPDKYDYAHFAVGGGSVGGSKPRPPEVWQQVTVRTNGFPVGWDENGASAEFVVPRIFIDGPRPQFLTLRTDFAVPSISAYDWPRATQAANVDERTVSFDVPEQQFDRYSPGLRKVQEPVRASVRSESASRVDANFLFLAGALVGTAGGAVIAAFDALVTDVWRRRRRRDGAASPPNRDPP